jgi:hypothetical protein
MADIIGKEGGYGEYNEIIPNTGLSRSIIIELAFRHLLVAYSSPILAQSDSMDALLYALFQCPNFDGYPGSVNVMQ